MGFLDNVNTYSKAADYEIKRLKQQINFTQNRQERERLEKKLHDLEGGQGFSVVGAALFNTLFK